MVFSYSLTETLSGTPPIILAESLHGLGSGDGLQHKYGALPLMNHRSHAPADLSHKGFQLVSRCIFKEEGHLGIPGDFEQESMVIQGNPIRKGLARLA